MKCIVYGFGKIGQLMVKQFLDKGWDIPIIIDKTNAGRTFQGIDIIGLEDFDVKKFEHIPILIALQSHEAGDEVITLL